MKYLIFDNRRKVFHGKEYTQWEICDFLFDIYPKFDHEQKNIHINENMIPMLSFSEREEPSQLEMDMWNIYSFYSKNRFKKEFRIYHNGRIIPPSIIKEWLNSFDHKKMECIKDHRIEETAKPFPEIAPKKGLRK